MRKITMSSEELWLELAAMPPEIITDGRTVWVNSSVCLGRFSPMGVDVHGSAEEQIKEGKACLDCVVIPDWRRFVSSMKKCHNIDISDQYKPKWLETVDE